MPIYGYIAMFATAVIIGLIVWKVWATWFGKCVKCGRRAVTTTKDYAYEPRELMGIQWKCRKCGHEYSWRD